MYTSREEKCRAHVTTFTHHTNAGVHCERHTAGRLQRVCGLDIAWGHVHGMRLPVSVVWATLLNAHVHAPTHSEQQLSLAASDVEDLVRTNTFRDLADFEDHLRDTRLDWLNPSIAASS